MKRIFFDLDGTLAEWKESSLEELKKNKYFFNLKPQEEILKFARELSKKKDLEVYILSAFLTGCSALQDKISWCDLLAPEINNREFVMCGTNKAVHIIECFEKASLTKDYILIDDYSKNLNEWVQYGGKAIKWLNGINGKGVEFQGPRTGDVEELRRLIAS